MGGEHSWELPLRLEHRKVGLSSVSLSVFNVYKEDGKVKDHVAIRCNLIDKTMENQAGTLELIPFMASEKCYSRPSPVIGKS